MDPAVLAAVAGIAGAAVIRIIDWIGARKVGIGALQTELIGLYDATAAAQRERIAQLQSDLDDERARRRQLETRVEQLEEALLEKHAPTRRRRPATRTPEAAL